VLDGVDRAVEFLGQPALVPARLGRVDGGDQRQAEMLGEGDGGVRHQPVVGVDDVVLAVVAGPQRRTGQGVVESHRPGQQRAGRERERHRILGGADDAYAVDVLPQRRPGGVPGDHGDLVPGRGERAGEGVDVPAESADEHRRILPGEHQDAQSATGVDGDQVGVR